MRYSSHSPVVIVVVFSMELADLLANEYYRFHHTFTQAQLREFLGLMRRSALVLEKQQEDGVGLSLAGDITLRA